jgi:hypothetical protein
MMASPSAWLQEVERDGYSVLPRVFTFSQVEVILRDLGQALSALKEEGVVRSDAGSVYAARNLLTLWPEAAEVWRRPPLEEALAEILGPRFGLVRVLYFDKPPDQTWALPWHKDLTIAVRDNRLPSARFGKPTRKAGVPHVEAPREMLETMLTARIHLDDITDENGPLKVLPGSHAAGKTLALDTAAPQAILVDRGDVLLIRPLVAHCSNRSRDGTRKHRRILHLEFAAGPDLPDGYAWHEFIPNRGEDPCTPLSKAVPTS